jgi:hypothetical protein
VHSFEQDWRTSFAGLVRIGPVLVTSVEWEGSWWPRTCCRVLPVGFPGVEDAPAELRALLGSDDAAWDVLADWLGERGIGATPEQLRRGVDTAEGWFDARERAGMVAGPLATPLVTFDRELGYRVMLDRVDAVLEASGCYSPAPGA